jgi:CRISPR-associated protein Csd1
VILQSLCSYYDRLKNTPDVAIPEPGYAEQKVHFAIILKPDGTVSRVNDLRRMEGKRLEPELMGLPSLVSRSGQKPPPQFTWDNTKYVLGRTEKDASPQDRSHAVEMQVLFRSNHAEQLGGIDTPAVQAFLKFVRSWDPATAESLDHWDEIEASTSKGCNFVFRLEGEREYLHEKPEVRAVWQRIAGIDEKDKHIRGICLVTGKEDELARIHAAVKGVDDGKPQGGSLVGFNESAFESYGKKQSYNAPTGKLAAFQYTAALNYLLRRSPQNHQRIKIGDTTTVFWAERPSPVEDLLGPLLDPREFGDEGGDGAVTDVTDDTADTDRLQSFLEAVRDGHKVVEPDFDEEVKFYILGLVPNEARLSVRFWHASTVGAIVRRIGEHFADLAMVTSRPRDRQFPGLWDLLSQTGRKTKDIPPLLAGSVARSIFEGTRYPRTLLLAVINRIRADREINHARAGIIKAVLVRNARLSGRKETITMSLDKQNVEVAYRLGRLFAVLEKAQAKAINANATIKDRFYASASATPASVFPRLLRLSQHHIAKLPYGVKYERMIAEILEAVTSFPRHMSLEDQGRFAIGYYHQNADLWKKKEPETTGEAETKENSSAMG